MHRYTIQPSSALVIGLGVTGLSVIRYLHQAGWTVRAHDTRAKPPALEQVQKGYAGINISSGDLHQLVVNDNELVVVSPGIDLRHPLFKQLRDQGVPIIGDICLFLQAISVPVIAITGSNGKSTVTALVGDMLRAAGYTPLVAGNIGVPVLDALTDNQLFDIAVLEFSSFQLETIQQVGALSATILNISEDHMDRYPSMGDYVLAKARILRGSKNVVLPRHDLHLQQITQVNHVHLFALDTPESESDFGVQQHVNHRWLMYGTNKLMRLRDIPLVGTHNVENVLAAFALLTPLTLDLDKMVAAVKSFNGLPHRMQTVAEHNGIRWINDSKATNTGAASKALTSIKDTVVWLAGGQAKGAGFTVLAESLGKNIKLAILFGEDAKKIANAIADRVPCKMVASLEQAVATAGDAAVSGDVVLLSPACASFDMFDDFAHRGEEFERLAKHWIKRRAA